MKTLIMVIAFLVIFSTSVSAQLEKGSWIGGVSGSFGFGGRSSSNRVFSWSFNPSAMYLVKRNIALGIEMNNSFVHYKGSYTSGTENYSQKGVNYSLKLTPIVRKYFGNGQFRPYVGLSTGIVMEHMRGYSSYDGNTNTETGFKYYLAPQVGASWWLNDKVFLDLKASYNVMDSFIGSGYHTLDLNIGVGFKIGK